MKIIHISEGMHAVETVQLYSPVVCAPAQLQDANNVANTTTPQPRVTHGRLSVVTLGVIIFCWSRTAHTQWDCCCPLGLVSCPLLSITPSTPGPSMMHACSLSATCALPLQGSLRRHPSERDRRTLQYNNQRRISSTPSQYEIVNKIENRICFLSLGASRRAFHFSCGLLARKG
jgi:hypothetical protein